MTGGYAVETKKIKAFQGLRAIAIVAIFISHAGIGPFGCLGAWGVSVFFVLSGFLMMYNYLQRDTDPTFGVLFAYRKIKGLYPLHFLMMIVAMLYIILTKTKTIETLVKAFPFHLTLTQIWIPIPEYYATFNGVSWYLSATVFLYFCFPLILKMFRRINSSKIVILCVGGGDAD